MTISKNFKRFAGIALSAALLVTGVVVPKKLQDVDAASNIDLSEIAIGDGKAISLESFAEYDITGKVRSERSLVSVHFIITKDNGKSKGDIVQSAQWPSDNKEVEEQKAGVKKLNVKKTAMNKELTFKNLEDGKYKLLVSATDKKGVSVSKTVPFGIKCDAKSFVLRTYKAAFDRNINDSEMGKWLAVLDEKGAAGLVKDMFKTEEVSGLYDSEYLDRLYKATFRTRVKPGQYEYDEYDSYLDELRKKNGKERVANIFVDNYNYLENGIKKYNVALNK